LKIFLPPPNKKFSKNQTISLLSPIPAPHFTTITNTEQKKQQENNQEKQTISKIKPTFQNNPPTSPDYPLLLPPLLK
jgi:hypothetical protein